MFDFSLMRHCTGTGIRNATSVVTTIGEVLEQNTRNIIRKNLEIQSLKHYVILIAEIHHENSGGNLSAR